MPSHGRIPRWIGLLLLLGLAVLSNGACTSKFFSLPAATYGSHVYMLELNSADTFCKSQGFSKAGSVRKTNLDILGLPKSCTADKNGNIGTGNKGKNNFGDYNDGNNNIGSYNKGNSNWGDRNKGTNLRCNDATGTRKVVNTCNLKGIRKTYLLLHHPLLPPPHLPRSYALPFITHCFPHLTFPRSYALSFGTHCSSHLSSPFSRALPSTIGTSTLSSFSTNSACPSFVGNLR
ncbi:hypothetical protein ACKKBG_A19470 [Auxenochlorella protothecoides x Auxenochlorella symbiontica]